MHRYKILAFFLVSLIAAIANAEDDIGVTPYRPSVSNPAQLPIPGQLELEFGGLLSKTDDARRGNFPYQLKFAFDDEWGVLLGGDAYVRSADQGTIVHGIGDTTAVLKRAFLINDEIAFGLELSAKIPTAKDTIGSGKADYGVNAVSYTHLTLPTIYSV